MRRRAQLGHWLNIGLILALVRMSHSRREEAALGYILADDSIYSLRYLGDCTDGIQQLRNLQRSGQATVFVGPDTISRLRIALSRAETTGKAGIAFRRLEGPMTEHEEIIRYHKDLVEVIAQTKRLLRELEAIRDRVSEI